MHVKYKIVPISAPDPAHPGVTSLWMPILNVSINNPTTHSPQTRRFEAVVDSGAPDCYFHGNIGRAIGLKIDKGTKSTIGEILAAAAIDVYFHDVALWIGTDTLKIRAGFLDQISVAAILGRRGFFENSSSHSIRLPIRQESTFSDLATRNPLLILRLGRPPPKRCRWLPPVNEVRRGYPPILGT